MKKDVLAECKTAFLLLITFTVLTGFLYPMAVLGFGKLFFPWQANGSLLTEQGRVVGSLWIGQAFSSPKYFWGRPSATSPYPYNGGASAGSNAGPSNESFRAFVQQRITNVKDLGSSLPVPVDLVTASASGLDPDISPLAAFYQVPRVAKARGLSAKELNQLIDAYTQGRTFGLLGEPRVNVLQLNLALDRKEANHGSTPQS